jgi:predicted small metal-binding protein
VSRPAEHGDGTATGQGDVTVAKVIKCDCGFVVRGATDDELVANGQQHAKEVHGVDMTRDQVLALAQPE